MVVFSGNCVVKLEENSAGGNPPGGRDARENVRSTGLLTYETEQYNEF